MKIKTSELEGAALDWAVAKALNAPDDIAMKLVMDGSSPSTCWQEGGPFIEALDIEVGPGPDEWFALTSDGIMGYGTTPLVAVARVLVLHELGDTVDVPEELLS